MTKRLSAGALVNPLGWFTGEWANPMGWPDQEVRPHKGGLQSLPIDRSISVITQWAAAQIERGGIINYQPLSAVSRGPKIYLSLWAVLARMSLFSFGPSTARFLFSPQAEKRENGGFNAQLSS